MPKIVDRDRYRSELLDKSFELFAQKGYGSLTMREIAAGLEVSTGTLYHYFPSKQALFEQLIEESTQRDILNAFAEMGQPVTLQERLESIMRFVAEREDYFLQQSLICMNFYLAQPSDADERIREAFKQSSLRYRQAIAEFLQIDDLSIATFVLCQISGLIVERISDRQSIVFEEQAGLLGRLLAAYFNPRLDQHQKTDEPGEENLEMHNAKAIASLNTPANFVTATSKKNIKNKNTK